MDGGGVGMGVSGVPCMHTHAHMHTYTCMHMYVKHDKHGCHLQFLYMYTCVCMYVHVCGDTPNAPRHPHSPAPSPEPQGAQNTKIQ